MTSVVPLDGGPKDGLEFTAVVKRRTGEARRWYGMLEGAQIQGTFTWEVAGQEPREHVFEGSERETE